jgi:vancomycin permeability regulator SanA
MACAVARSLAFLLGGFTFVNLAGALATGFNANRWWIDTRALPPALAAVLLAVAAAALIAFAARPHASVPRRAVTAVLLAALLVIVLDNAATFWALAARGRIAPALPVPLSLGVAATLALLFVVVLRRHDACASLRFIGPAVAAIAVVGFPLAQIACFGKTDYRRPADAIVVFGARAYGDGRCSQALHDRVRTACDLHRAGLAPTLVFTGGPGDGDVHETEAMRRLAMKLGVPDESIVLDPDGVTTQDSVRATVPILDRLGARRVVAVSHFYHLPRIKLTYQRAGRDVCTVSARESYTLTKMPWFVGREVACWWLYYARALVS